MNGGCLYGIFYLVEVEGGNDPRIMPKGKKGTIRSVFEESPPVTGHYPGLQKIAEISKARMARLPQDLCLEPDYPKLVRAPCVISSKNRAAI